MHFSFGIITLLADFVDMESDEEVADKILTGGIVLVGLIAASFPVWPQEAISRDISPLASGKNFVSPVSIRRAKSTLSRNPESSVSLHVLDQNSGPLSQPLG